MRALRRLDLAADPEQGPTRSQLDFLRAEDDSAQARYLALWRSPDEGGPYATLRGDRPSPCRRADEGALFRRDLTLLLCGVAVGAALMAYAAFAGGSL